MMKTVSQKIELQDYSAMLLAEKQKEPKQQSFMLKVVQM